MGEIKMSEKVDPIPKGYERVIAYLVCKNAEAAIDFYTRAFGAEELFRMGSPGKIGHAEMKLGESIFMLADEHPEIGAISPQSGAGSPISLMFYVEDVDAFAENALKEGLKVLRPLEDQFYGDRMGFFVDPFGHQWSIATHIRDVSHDEMSQISKKGDD